jgi:hypothetical protein
MWFWGLAGVVVASGVAVAGLYDRRLRKRGYRLRKGGDIDRDIAKRAKWDADPGGGSGF